MDALRYARALVKWYIEGSDINPEEMHLLIDCATEHDVSLDEAVNYYWFIKALAENIQALR